MFLSCFESLKTKDHIKFLISLTDKNQKFLIKKICPFHTVLVNIIKTVDNKNMFLFKDREGIKIQLQNTKNFQRFV